MNIRFYYENTELTLQQIADRLGSTYKIVWSFVAKEYSKEHRTNRKRNSYRSSKLGALNPMKDRYRELHPNYVGVVSDSKGYLLVLKPAWYLGRKNSKHVFQHHVIVCECMGIAYIPKGWVVHHCDMDTHNNSFDNLVLMTMGDHARLHSQLEGATTISKESTLKWVETHGTAFSREDIV